MTFAITGANGFLGVHIIHHLLLQGHKVKAIIRPSASLEEFSLITSTYELKKINAERLSWHECELYDILGLQEIINGCDYVMHLAGMISYLQKDLDTMMEVNETYTANIVNVALASGVSKLLYCSSIAAISKNKNGDPITEDTDWDKEISHSNYGLTKHLGECEVWRGQEEGLDTVVINPGIILGYANWDKGSNKLFKNAATSFPFYSEGITGWVGVQDVAQIAEQLCLSNIKKERYIIVSQNRSFKEMAFAMAESFGTKKPRTQIKGLLYNIAYAVVSVKEFLGIGGMLSKETVRASIAINRFDNTKIKKALDYQFEDMEEVVEKAVQFYSTKK